MTDDNRPQTASHDPPRGTGIGFALFLVLAGALLLAENMGWLPEGTDWLFPLILIAWGLSELVKRLGAKG